MTGIRGLLCGVLRDAGKIMGTGQALHTIYPAKLARSVPHWPVRGGEDGGRWFGQDVGIAEGLTE
jgi:hypothetical protein